MPDVTKNAAASRPVEPLDLAHLDRQTFGDAGLRRDVLKLFLDETATVFTRMSEAGDDVRRQSAHRLAGSARAVGAFALAAAAAEVEVSPASDAVLDRLAVRIEEVRAFIVKMH